MCLVQIFEFLHVCRLKLKCRLGPFRARMLLLSREDRFYSSNLVLWSSIVPLSSIMYLDHLSSDQTITLISTAFTCGDLSLSLGGAN